MLAEGFEDYYRILQVHNLAEPEVIESAYKRLVKKYHPDYNRDGNAEEIMKKIQNSKIATPSAHGQKNR